LIEHLQIRSLVLGRHFIRTKKKRVG
jgi:hypothetical protein